jgi:hypothetical protein
VTSSLTNEVRHEEKDIFGVGLSGGEVYGEFCVYDLDAGSSKPWSHEECRKEIVEREKGRRRRRKNGEEWVRKWKSWETDCDWETPTRKNNSNGRHVINALIPTTVLINYSEYYKI